MRFLVFCISSLENCLCKPFSYFWSVFLLLRGKNSFYILGKVSFTVFFSHSVGCPPLMPYLSVFLWPLVFFSLLFNSQLFLQNAVTEVRIPGFQSVLLQGFCPLIDIGQVIVYSTTPVCSLQKKSFTQKPKFGLIMSLPLPKHPAVSCPKRIEWKQF